MQLRRALVDGLRLGHPGTLSRISHFYRIRDAHRKVETKLLAAPSNNVGPDCYVFNFTWTWVVTRPFPALSPRHLLSVQETTNPHTTSP